MEQKNLLMTSANDDDGNDPNSHFWSNINVKLPRGRSGIGIGGKRQPDTFMYRIETTWPCLHDARTTLLCWSILTPDNQYWHNPMTNTFEVHYLWTTQVFMMTSFVVSPMLLPPFSSSLQNIMMLDKLDNWCLTTNTWPRCHGRTRYDAN